MEENEYLWVRIQHGMVIETDINLNIDCRKPCPKRSGSTWTELGHTGASGKRSGAEGGCDSGESMIGRLHMEA